MKKFFQTRFFKLSLLVSAYILGKDIIHAASSFMQNAAENKSSEDFPIEVSEYSNQADFLFPVHMEDNSNQENHLKTALGHQKFQPAASGINSIEWENEGSEPNFIHFPATYQGSSENHFFENTPQVTTQTPSSFNQIGVSQNVESLKENEQPGFTAHSPKHIGMKEIHPKASENEKSSKIIAQAAPAPTETPNLTQPNPVNPPVITPENIRNPTHPIINAPVNPNATPDQPQIPANQPQNPPGQPRQEQPLASKPPILINFNNVSIIEYIRFISRITNKNFVFDENDLQFNVTIISEEPTSLENVMTALLQELRIHDLNLLEEGNNLIIHRNPKLGNLGTVISEVTPATHPINAELVTQVFRLNTLDADKAAAILKPMLSDSAIIEVLKDTNYLIITDLTANIIQISKLLKSIDAPQSGLVIGQYVVRNSFIDNLIQLAEKVLLPISRDQILTFVPHHAANSIFIVSTPYLVERSLSILQYLDQTQGTTQILNPKELKFEVPTEGAVPTAPGEVPPTPSPEAIQGQWKLDQLGNWLFQLSGTAATAAAANPAAPPEGNWSVDPQGNWYFQSGQPAEFGGKGPEGEWVKDPNGNWIFKLARGKSISPEKLTRTTRYVTELPVGHIERTQFYIHKLRYRRGDQIAKAMVRIAESLQAAGTTNADLITSINSIQWLESSNSLIFTGTPESLDKVKELIDEIDSPLRQVFLEMLILETTVDDSLDYSCNLAARFGGGHSAGAEAFLSGASTLPAAIDTAVPPALPNAAGLSRIAGFTLGVIGQTITHNGQEFATLGALVRAVHTKTTTRVVLNPKILTEDNSPAEIFVGENTQFPTQSISNDLGSIVTQNFEFRDVGTRLKVTPLIGNNDVITLDIEEEVSEIISGGTTVANLSNQVIGPTTSISRTTTKVHMPNGYFLVISGHIRNDETRTRIQVPCLGGIPILGAAFSDKHIDDTKRNLMIFIRPLIIDTVEEIQNLTKHQQDIFRVKNRRMKSWKFETIEALDLFNLEDTEDSEGELECY